MSEEPIIPTAPVAAEKASVGSGRSSAIIGAGILLSRVLGLFRQSLIAGYLGVGTVSDAFNGAFKLTNFLQNLFGEGALSASFIPVYAAAVARGDEKEADRIAGAVAAILALVTAIIVALGVVFAPYVVELVVGGFTGRKLELTILLTRILFPGAGIFVMSAWCLGILNSHRRFFLSYAAPVFWNIAMIAALLVYGPRRGDADLAVMLAWASVLGAVLQMGVQLPTVFRLVRHPRFRLDTAHPPVREVMRNFGPAFMSRGVVQISGFIDTRIASHIAFDGVVTLLQNAQTIYMLPISLFGMSVSAAELPEMSRTGGAGPEALERIRQRLNAALPRVAFFVVPSAIGFMVLGEAIAGVLLEHGEFVRADSLRTWAILAGSAIGLLASAQGRLYSSTFNALRDTRTPLRFALIRIALAVAMGLAFAFWLPPLLGLPAWTGAVGLSVASGLSGWVEFVLLRRALNARIGSTGLALPVAARLWAAGLVAAVAGYAVMHFVDPRRQMVRGTTALAVFSLVYGLATLALGVPEARGLVRRFTRR
ncbi:MAG: integral rane protein MviN [Gemmatimonadetes bacterium]|nr:integral rane protein MviN [Gemmatimonadota bacterium]